jgi:hypothetical protein
MRRKYALPESNVNDKPHFTVMAVPGTTWSANSLGSDAVDSYESRADVIAAIAGYRTAWIESGSLHKSSEILVVDRSSSDVYLADLAKSSDSLRHCGCYMSKPLRVPTRIGFVVIGGGPTTGES